MSETAESSPIILSVEQQIMLQKKLEMFYDGLKKRSFSVDLQYTDDDEPEECEVGTEIEMSGDFEVDTLLVNFGWNANNEDVESIVHEALDNLRNQIISAKKSGLLRILKSLDIPEDYIRYLM